MQSNLMVQEERIGIQAEVTSDLEFLQFTRNVACASSRKLPHHNLHGLVVNAVPGGDFFNQHFSSGVGRDDGHVAFGENSFEFGRHHSGIPRTPVYGNYMTCLLYTSP